MSVPFSDNFNRADGALGSPWAQMRDALEIDDDEVRTTNTDAFAFIDTEVTDQVVEADVILDGSGSFYVIDVCVRANPDDNEGGFVLGWNSYGDISISAIGDGTFTPLTSDVDIGTSGTKRLRLEAEGTALRGYVDDVLTVSTTSALFSSNTHSGISIYRSDGTTGAIDNVEITEFGAPSGFDGSYVRTAAGTAVRIREAGGDYAALYDASGDRWEV